MNMTARYPTQDALNNPDFIKYDKRTKCKWFYTNTMKLIADRNNETIKIRKMRNGGHYVEITS